MNICFFSDSKSNHFKPLTLTRPLDDIRIGIYTIREKWLKLLKPNSWIRQVEDYLSVIFPTGIINQDEDYVWVNTRFLPSKDLIQAVSKLQLGESLTWHNQLVAARIDGLKTKDLISTGHYPETESAIQLEAEPKELEYLWDLLSENAEQIAFDISLSQSSFIRSNVFDDSVVLKNESQIFIHESATIEPGCILMANDGPIFIDRHAKIEAGSIIKGPVAICEKAEIKMGGRIFNGSTIGPVSKVGGEVNNCIFHSYSNKAHEGFAGNSIIGQWCNFGADTNTSNLKNNYSLVRLPNWDTGELSESGVQFLGTIFGDFSKTAINTSLNTGTVCGVSSNIFSSGFPPKVIPSFTWLGETSMPYDFEKAIIAMKAMMIRRGIDLTDDYIEMMRFIKESKNSSGL